MDEGGIGLVCVTDDNGKLQGIITDGDFRRALLKDISLNENVQCIWNTKFHFVDNGYKREEVHSIFLSQRLRHLPVLKNEQLVDIILEEEYYGLIKPTVSEHLDCPVVIMAGGKGTRLDPFTRILPKPLIPIGDKAMIEIVIDEFRKYGINDFYISVNHKGKMIKAFFEDRKDDYNITYLEEEKPLGTAGSLKQLAGELSSPFFVSNCDIFVKNSFKEIFDFHKSGKFSLTLVASLQHHEVPYGVCKLSDSGQLTELIEKPEYDFLVNTGVYILEPRILKFIPEGKYYHITDLVNELLKRNETIGVYPVSEKSWVDVGRLENYNLFLANIGLQNGV